MARLRREIVAIVFNHGCISLDGLMEELRRRLGVDVDRSLVRNLVYQLKKRGRIVAPVRGVYCAPHAVDALTTEIVLGNVPIVRDGFYRDGTQRYSVLLPKQLNNLWRRLYEGGDFVELEIRWNDEKLRVFARVSKENEQYKVCIPKTATKEIEEKIVKNQKPFIRVRVLERAVHG